jgi:hypothetical protein
MLWSLEPIIDQLCLLSFASKIPDVTVSQEALDFGMVQTGHSMVTTLQLHNYRQVCVCVCVYLCLF